MPMAPRFRPPYCIPLEVNYIPYDVFVFTEAYHNDVYRSDDEHVEYQLRQHAALSQPPRDINRS